MKVEIQGDLAQVAKLTLLASDKCWASGGALMSLDPDLKWSLKMPSGGTGAIRRILSGEGLALTYIEGSRDGQQVTLSSNQPGKIIEWDLADGPVVTTRGSFVAAYGPKIDIDVTTAKRAGAAFFGGAGLFLQKISGEGRVLIHGAGDYFDTRLKSGESLQVSTGNLAAFSEGVDYTIQATGDVRRMLFSGEGLFMTRMTGPGRVILQSLKRGHAVQTRAV
ncbi:MAG: AIM24 family protein [Akkermansiaceae bacterium]